MIVSKSTHINDIKGLPDRLVTGLMLKRVNTAGEMVEWLKKPENKIKDLYRCGPMTIIQAKKVLSELKIEEDKKNYSKVCPDCGEPGPWVALCDVNAVFDVVSMDEKGTVTERRLFEETDNNTTSYDCQCGYSVDAGGGWGRDSEWQGLEVVEVSNG